MMALLEKITTKKGRAIISVSAVMASVFSVIIAALVAIEMKTLNKRVLKETTLVMLHDSTRRIDEAVTKKIDYETQICREICREICDENTYEGEKTCGVVMKMNCIEQKEAYVGNRTCVLDENGNPDVHRAFTYEYISNNNKIEGFVFQILNEYTSLCIGGNDGIIDNDVIYSLRGVALEQTWDQYDDFIKEYRYKNCDDEAWKPCDDWLSTQLSHKSKPHHFEDTSFP